MQELFEAFSKMISTISEVSGDSKAMVSVDEYNGLVHRYNDLLDEYNVLVNKFNKLLADRDALSLRVADFEELLATKDKLIKALERGV